MDQREPKVDQAVIEAGNNVICEAKCFDRGEDRGKAHVFRGSDVCQCGEVDLTKERMR